MSDSALPVLIVGGGIAGLTTALTLHQLGIKAQVFEAAEEPRPLGVGIVLWIPHHIKRRWFRI